MLQCINWCVSTFVFNVKERKVDAWKSLFSVPYYIICE